MSISNVVRIDTHYTRSINIERDMYSPETVDSYIPTSRAKQTLERIELALSDGKAQRAWALTGPYGSGKSIFAVFCAHLLGDPGLGTTQTAFDVLESEPDLADRFRKHSLSSKGFCPVLITGTPEPLGRRYLMALASSAEQYWSTRKGRSPRIVEELKDLVSGIDKIGVNQLVTLTSKLQEAVVKSGGNGVLVVFDELGKFLEYEARHYGANDIFLLQSLAEHAYAGGKGKLLVLALLHQAFDQYARGLGEKLRNEWAKIQGRYENIPFLESAEQVLRVVALAFDPALNNSDKKVVGRKVKAFVESVVEEKSLPGGVRKQEAKALFSRCYPLHPLALMLLPKLCQKVAQNERTLFSYLGSQEPHGFRDSLEHIGSIGEWIYPSEVYDYFILNQSSSLFDHITSRRWAEVVTALDRLGDAPKDEIQLLKTIGLLNIIGAQGAIKASKSLLLHCLPTSIRAERALSELVEKSVVQFRRYSGEYRVWQGSDFDLEEALAEARNQIGYVALAESLNKRTSITPVIARRHTIQTGTVRYFQPIFVDDESFRSYPPQGDIPRIIFYLSEGAEFDTSQEREIARFFSKQDLVAICPIGSQLRETVTDATALERVRSGRQELNSDPVASREVRDALATAQRMEKRLVDSLLESPADSRWFWAGEIQEITDKRGLQQSLSAVMSELYHAAPEIKNELINRDKLSSQAAAARNKLLGGLLHHTDQKDLGIGKYPPEKAIYRSLFWASGMHVLGNDSKWHLISPSEGADPLHFRPLWRRIEDFFSESETKPKSLGELGEILVAPPFGLKEGVLPVIFIAAYLIRQDEIALYEDREYIPVLTDELLDRFVRRPEAFRIQLFRISGMRASIYKEYGKALWDKVEHEQSILAIAKPLIRFIRELPACAMATKRISDVSQKVRQAFNLSSSPEQLLFDLLPQACGYPPLDPNDDTKPDQLSGFAETLTGAFRELKSVFPNLLEEQRLLLANAFHVNKDHDLETLRTMLRGRSDRLEKFTVDVDGLRAFIMRLSSRDGNAKAWLKGLMLFLGRKPVDKWTDADRTAAEYRLSEYSHRWRDLETLRVQFDKHSQRNKGDFDVALLRLVRQGHGEQDRVVVVDAKSAAATKNAKYQLESVLDELGSKELRLIVLSELLKSELFASDENSDMMGVTSKPKTTKTG